VITQPGLDILRRSESSAFPAYHAAIEDIFIDRQRRGIGSIGQSFIPGQRRTTSLGRLSDPRLHDARIAHLSMANC
jgi:hypothetical protein